MGESLPEQGLYNGPALQLRGHDGGRQSNTARIFPCAITLSSHVGAKDAYGCRGCVFVAKTKSFSSSFAPPLLVAALLLPMGINAGSSLYRRRLSRWSLHQEVANPAIIAHNGAERPCGICYNRAGAEKGKDVSTPHSLVCCWYKGRTRE